MNARPRVMIDTETTSLASTRRPWEIAVIQDRPDGPVESVFVVTPVDLSEADPRSLAMNGIYDRHPQFDLIVDDDPNVLYLPEAEVAQALHLMLDGAEVVAAQPAFDLECIAAMLRRHGLEPSWHYRTRCIESETDGYLRADVGGLQDCADRLGVERDRTQAHSALGDARLVRECWRVIHGVR